MHNITLTCPNCNVPSKAVGDPEEPLGHEGDWYCFSCKSSGHYKIDYEVKVAATPAPPAA